MKGKNIFLTFGFLIIVWACSFFAVSSKAGGVDLLCMEARIQVSGEEIAAEEEQCWDWDWDIAAEDEGEILPEPAFLVLNIEQTQMLILDSYRDPEFMSDVVAFFGEITGSQEIAEVILFNASAFNIPPSLAFALCAEESRFNPMAFNRNRNETVDRGLFQLNSGSFPDLPIQDFYDPEINTRNGLSYLRRCLDTAGSEVSALAMYNAGTTRVRTAGTPQSTLDYISRILRRQRNIEERFMVEYVRIVEERSVDIGYEHEYIAEVEAAPFRLSLLTPLGR